jgi:sugar phosphate isomerase/epimerase
MNQYPKLHNALWPGVVGKGAPGAEPFIDFDSMLDLTVKAEVNGVKFDGVDLFLHSPHTDIDSDDAELEALADRIGTQGLVIGSLVAPVWFDASAMGDVTRRANWVTAVRKACRIGKKLREIGIRPYGVIRIDSSCSVSDWSKDRRANTALIAATFREAAAIAEDYGERLAAEGEICWGGMHSWRVMTELLEEVDRPRTVGFQADMAHTLLYALGYNAEEDALLPAGYDWKDQSQLDAALKTLAEKLRPWTFDFHVAQNDATVKGSGNHDKTGRHCLADDPNGKLDIARHAGFWLRDQSGLPTRAFQHICWDGCMFPNDTMRKPETWNNILRAMIQVRTHHGWSA